MPARVLSALPLPRNDEFRACLKTPYARRGEAGKEAYDYTATNTQRLRNEADGVFKYALRLLDEEVVVMHDSSTALFARERGRFFGVVLCGTEAELSRLAAYLDNVSFPEYPIDFRDADRKQAHYFFR